MLGAVAGAVGKAALSGAKHLVGHAHLDAAIQKLPVTPAQAVEALGSRGLAGVFIGFYFGNPEFRSHVDAALKAVLPGFGG